MSANGVWSQYETQLGYYNQVNAVRESIVSIKGVVEAALTMFDFAKDQIGTTKQVVDGAKIVLESFKSYEGILNENKVLIDETDTKMSDYVDALNTAFDKTESDLEIIHGYMTYLYNKYYYGIDQEIAGNTDWESSYPSYKGEKFRGFN